ncbi:hypothetical protein K503DRAFT_312388 [Rhizopogon vinicolor AM-OR11-026]|uniref:Uncharacterized protein n=1 Tax=Rhizopogon vinicolor AM-OR11-026 TaxID=1314800 RepID=A0A1B7MUM8_9AGAM|nr:hypothetical protein K503DRAFT_312388 [Rhizopogon vinicolor AM-OR11-026]
MTMQPKGQPRGIATLLGVVESPISHPMRCLSKPLSNMDIEVCLLSLVRSKTLPAMSSIGMTRMIGIYGLIMIFTTPGMKILVIPSPRFIIVPETRGRLQRLNCNVSYLMYSSFLTVISILMCIKDK